MRSLKEQADKAKAAVARANQQRAKYILAQLKAEARVRDIAHDLNLSGERVRQIARAAGWVKP